MLNKNYKNLNAEEKQIAITRLSEHIHVPQDVLREVLLKMNPALSIIDGKAVIHRNTLMRLRKRIIEHTK
ncbi:hypothetical protein [Aquimarina sp. I32.4]|uniref:hypothetical protein n=1 Tax=Aquimarina sp. I32.4 TaxID=2053903 RepID=UPI000CDEAB39|nr:hypothetical protein [Aquimarina sp. I32.4]